MGLLINSSMKQALPVAELSPQLFPTAEPETSRYGGDRPDGSRERGTCRAQHTWSSSVAVFIISSGGFLGFGSVWIPIAAKAATRTASAGRCTANRAGRCTCGARVLELYTCRNCGTAYARAYTDDLDVSSDPLVRTRPTASHGRWGHQPAFAPGPASRTTNSRRSRRTSRLRSRNRAPQSSNTRSAHPHRLYPQ